MNLFYNPTISELDAIVNECRDGHDSFTILVDNDGEVIIDQSAELSDSFLARHKFYIKDFKYWKHAQTKRFAKLKTLNQLYKNLIFCWENNINGQVNFQRITDLQNEMHFREVQLLNEDAYPISVNVRFY